jgi:hypothetical protein
MEKIKIKKGATLQVVKDLPDGRTEILFGEFSKGSSSSFYIRRLLRKIYNPKENSYDIFDPSSSEVKLLWKEVKKIFLREKPLKPSLELWDDQGC